MENKEAIAMSWSGGKDSSFALYQILKEDKYKVKYLLTNIYQPNGRVSMHGIPEALIEKQAERIGIPLIKLYIEEKTHDEYDIKMKELLLQLKAKGIQTVAFGDIFLEDLKVYRETRLAEVAMKALFPLWKKDTKSLALAFLKNGFKTHICSIDTGKVPENLVGIDYSTSFLDQLPSNVDPCGENGEFHSFCYEGPIFKDKIAIRKNGIVTKSYSHNGQEFHYLFSDLSYGH